MKVVLYCQRAFQLTSDQMRDMIPQSELERIRKHDPNPEFRAYVLASEGEAYPEIHEEDGSRGGGIVEMTREAVRQMAQVVKKGVRFFVDHSHYTGSEEMQLARYRPGQAEVVASEAIERDGKVYNVAIAYWPPETRQAADSYPSVSVEMEFEYDRQGDRTIIEKVLEVFGIALLDKKKSPAFEDAHEVGILHAHRAAKAEDTGGDPKPYERKQMSVKEAHFDELVSELKNRNAQFWQIFDTKQLMGQKQKLRDGTVQYIGGDREFQSMVLEMRKEIEDEIDQSYKTKVAELEEKAKEADSLRDKARKAEAIPALKRKLQEKKVDPKLSQFVQNRADRFDPGEDPDTSADEFIETLRKDFDEIVSLGGGDPSPAHGGGDGAPGDDTSSDFFGVDDVE